MKNLLKLKQTKHRNSYNSNLFTFKLLFTFGLAFRSWPIWEGFAALKLYPLDCRISMSAIQSTDTVVRRWKLFALTLGSQPRILLARDMSGLRLCGSSSIFATFKTGSLPPEKKYQKHTVNTVNSDLKTDFCDWHRQGAITSGGEGCTQKNWVGVCVPLSKTPSR